MKSHLKYLMLVLALVFVSNVDAAKYDIKKMTPDVSKALEHRRDRFDQLHELKSKGIVGENNHGYVEIFQKDASAQSLVEAENHDRKIIYQTIALQNGIENELNIIEKVFAQVQREKSESGERIQDDQGQWSQK